MCILNLSYTIQSLCVKCLHCILILYDIVLLKLDALSFSLMLISDDNYDDDAYDKENDNDKEDDDY